MAQSAPSAERATLRTVVLLRRSEKAQLERLAARQKISSAEVIRRFIRNGEAFLRNQQEEQVIEASLKLISSAVSETNAALSRTMDKLDRLHEDLASRDIR